MEQKTDFSKCERYITEELKEYEEKILGAEEKILSLGNKLFNDLVFNVSDYIQPIQLKCKSYCPFGLSVFVCNCGNTE